MVSTGVVECCMSFLLDNRTALICFGVPVTEYAIQEYERTHK
jgi:hypothetical protein